MPPISQRIAGDRVGDWSDRTKRKLGLSILFCSGASSMACDHVLGREHFKATRQTFVKREIEAIVD